MAQDTATIIPELNPNLPADIDPRCEFPWAVRNVVKKIAKTTFPEIKGPVEVSSEEINKLVGFPDTPVGTIVMFYGFKIPDGWVLCDGQTVNTIETPDLRDMFVRGATSLEDVGPVDTPNNRDMTASYAGFALKSEHTPVHYHQMYRRRSYRDNNFPFWEMKALGDGYFHADGNNPLTTLYSTTFGGGAVHTHGATNKQVNITPKHKVLAYIMYVGEDNQNDLY